jgi:Calcineurin-like phosphoesterase
VRKDLDNFSGAIHSGLASHIQAGASNYSTTTYDPLNAFGPGNLLAWASHVARFWFRRKFPYRDYTTSGHGTGIHRIESRAKLSLIGDWGTGTDEAQMVANQVAKAESDFTIHLGDVYYVGDETEVRENFLGEKTSPYQPVKWPMGTKGSFALCGNHEMYARGVGYYRFILPHMGLREAGSEWGSGQWAAFFCLENEHWRIVGIDTAYHSTNFDWGKMPVFQRSKLIRKSVHFKPRCTIPQPVLQWLAGTINPDGDRRGLIVLSHHGSFSSFSDWYRIPAQQLAQIIHRPVLWFWGHEHRFAIYDQFAVDGGISTYGRCVGHGGMPVERGAPDIDDCRWLAWDNRRYDNGEPINVGFNGHANLILDGPVMRAEYQDLNGALLFTEEWRVDLATGLLEGPRLQKMLQDDAVHVRAPLDQT